VLDSESIHDGRALHCEATSRRTRPALQQATGQELLECSPQLRDSTHCSSLRTRHVRDGGDTSLGRNSVRRLTSVARCCREVADYGQRAQGEYECVWDDWLPCISMPATAAGHTRPEGRCHDGCDAISPPTAVSTAGSRRSRRRGAARPPRDRDGSPARCSGDIHRRNHCRAKRSRMGLGSQPLEWRQTCRGSAPSRLDRTPEGATVCPYLAGPCSCSRLLPPSPATMRRCLMSMRVVQRSQRDDATGRARHSTASFAGLGKARAGRSVVP
jgi:hypothetical protein